MWPDPLVAGVGLDSIPDGQDSTSASSWFKGIMEDDGPGSRVFTSFNNFMEKFKKRWITGTPLEERRTSSDDLRRTKRRPSVSTQRG